MENYDLRPTTPLCFYTQTPLCPGRFHEHMTFWEIHLEGPVFLLETKALETGADPFNSLSAVEGHSVHLFCHLSMQRVDKIWRHAGIHDRHQICCLFLKLGRFRNMKKICTW